MPVCSVSDSVLCFDVVLMQLSLSLCISNTSMYYINIGYGALCVCRPSAFQSSCSQVVRRLCLNFCSSFLITYLSVSRRWDHRSGEAFRRRAGEVPCGRYSVGIRRECYVTLHSTSVFRDAYKNSKEQRIMHHDVWTTGAVRRKKRDAAR